MSGLKERVLRLIAGQGPISVAQFMQLALTDPEHGYYMRRDPMGRDFITAPEVSQMFGELIGLFFVQAWEDRGSPSRFRLVELGPGRGTLMADLLRAARIRPLFVEAAAITLIEASPHLRAVQAKTLEGSPLSFADALHGIPGEEPLYLVANEFFDALPLRQFVRILGRWHERMVSAEGDALIFTAAPDPLPAAAVPAFARNAPDGSVFELCAAAEALSEEIGWRVAQSSGVALIIDYGRATSGLGDTLQALKVSRPVDPLAEPGEADLTAHVDFAALAAAARRGGAAVAGPITQGAFLRALGIEARASRLKRAAPDETGEIDAALDRLAGEGQMGALFKAMGLCAPGSPPLPGFP